MNIEFYTGVDERLAEPLVRSPAPNPLDLAGARVLVVDDVADTGATLRVAQQFCTGHAVEVRCAVLYEKPGSVIRCEYVWRRTDRWITFPWSPEPGLLPGAQAESPETRPNG